MTSKLPQRLQIVVENICNAGCQRTYEIIAILGHEGDVAETGQLSEHERKQVLTELKNIMSIYQQKWTCSARLRSQDVYDVN